MSEQTVHDVRRIAAEMDARRARQIQLQIASMNRLMGNTNKGQAAAEEIRRLAEELATAQERLETLRSKVLTAVNGDAMSPLCAQRVRNAVEESQK